MLRIQNVTMGQKGEKGPQGATGPQGSSGYVGMDGATGPQGFQGLIGPQGYQGLVGPQGFQGSIGPQGFQGNQGSIGPQGYQGNQGPTGPQGFQGNQGFQGPTGIAQNGINTGDMLVWDGTNWTGTAQASSISYETLSSAPTGTTALTPETTYSMCNGTPTVSTIGRLRSCSASSLCGVTSSNVIVVGTNSAAVTIYNGDGTTGATTTYNANVEATICAFSKTGVFQWTSRIKSSGSQINNPKGCCDSLGNIYILATAAAGTTTFYNQTGVVAATMTGAGDYDCMVAKYNSSGSLQWVSKITSSLYDGGQAISCFDNNSIYVAGLNAATGYVYNMSGATGASIEWATVGGSWNGFILKYTSTGSVVWKSRWIGANVIPRKMINDSSGIYLTIESSTTVPTFIYNNSNIQVGTITPISTNASSAVVKYDHSGAYQYYMMNGTSFGNNGGSTFSLTSYNDTLYSITTFVNPFSFYLYNSNNQQIKVFNSVPTGGSASGTSVLFCKYTQGGTLISADYIGYPSKLVAANVYSSNKYGLSMSFWISGTGTNNYLYNTNGKRYDRAFDTTGDSCIVSQYDFNGNVLFGTLIKGTYEVQSAFDDTNIYLFMNTTATNVVVELPYGSGNGVTLSGLSANESFIFKMTLASYFSMANPASSPQQKTLTSKTSADGTIMSIALSSPAYYKSATYSTINLTRKGAMTNLLWDGTNWIVLNDNNALYV